MARQRTFTLSGSRSYLEALAPLILVALIFLMYHLLTKALVSCEGWGARCQPINITQFFAENGLCCHSAGAGKGAVKGAVMQGRFLWLFLTGLNLLACLVTVGVGIYIVSKLLEGRSEQYRRRFAGALILLTLLVLGIFLMRDPNLNRLVDCQQGYPSDRLGGVNPNNRLVNQFLACTATMEMPSIIAVSNWTIAFSYMAAFLLVLLSSTILWPIPKKDNHQPEEEISERIKLLRLLLYTGMLQLVISTLRLSATFNWSLTFLPQEEKDPAAGAAKALGNLSTTLSSTEAATYTLILVAVYLPALFILRNRACMLVKHEECPTPTEREKWLQDKGLSISISAYIPRLAAILAPLLAGPLGDLIGRFLRGN